MKTATEVFLWMPVDGWCLGVDALRQKSEIIGNTAGVRRPSNAHWQQALLHGKTALALGLEANDKKDGTLAQQFMKGKHIELVKFLDALEEEVMGL